MSPKAAPVSNVFYRNQNWRYPKLTHGAGIYVFDEQGNRYVDGCSGSAVANIGHGNQEVAEHTAAQIKTLAFAHLSRFTTEPLEECARRISKLTPGDLNHAYFVSGGSEATESAWKLARQYFVERDGTSSKTKVISRWTSFHGNTMGSLSMTGITGRRKVYEPVLASFPKISQAYCYRCPYKSEYPTCGLACAHELEGCIKRLGADNVTAFIAEPVVGSAAPGITPPKEYFKVVREICTHYDVLLIIDEVMAGFGRTGKNFGIDHFDVVPDIMTLAKGMSCGYSPLGAAVVSDKVWRTIMIEGSGRFIHGHTYGGNPLSAAVANCVLEIIERERYIDNAASQGTYMLDAMQSLYDIPIVGDVRGKGLMIGVELVRDQRTKEPFDVQQAARSIVTECCLEAGLVIYPGGGAIDGERGDHFLLAPPINIARHEVDELVDALHRGLSATAKKLVPQSK